MTLYDVSNPSDAYTFEAPDTTVAFVVVALLGNGGYGATPIGDDKAEKIPIFLFGGADDWMRERGIVIDRVLADRKPAIIESLDSVLIGDAHDRQAFRDGLELIDDPAKRVQWRDRWHDDRRSSMNNIGKRAWTIAARLRGEKVKIEPSGLLVMGS